MAATAATAATASTAATDASMSAIPSEATMGSNPMAAVEHGLDVKGEIAPKHRCPSCGEFRVLHQKIGQSAIAVAISGVREIKRHFQSAGVELLQGGPSLKTCSGCNKVAKLAVAVAREKYPGCGHFRFSSSSHGGPAVEASAVIKFKEMYLADLFRGISVGKVPLDISIFNDVPCSLESEFSVGDVVTVAKRMEPGVNKPGGTAKITNVTQSKKGEYLYDVSYVLGTKETDIPASLLKVQVLQLSRPRRSMDASQAAEEQAVERLERKLVEERERHEAVVANLNWQNSLLRGRLHAKNSEVTSAKADLTKAVAALAAANIQRVADFNAMMAQVLTLTEEAAAAASKEAMDAHTAKVLEITARHKVKEREKTARIAELESIVTARQGKLLILESSVASMLLDQAEVLRAEHRETETAMADRHAMEKIDQEKQHKHELRALQNQKAAAEAAKYRAEHAAALAVKDAAVEFQQTAAKLKSAEKQNEELEAELMKLRAEVEAVCVKPCLNSMPLSQLCKAVLSEEENELVSKIPSLDQLGLSAGSVDAMGERRRRELATVVNLLVSRILVVAKAGSADPRGILDAISKLRFAAKLPLGAALQEQPPLDPAQYPAVKALAQSYITSLRAGDKATARAMLSVLASSGELTEMQVVALCTDKRDVSAGQTVVVVREGNTRTSMVVEAIADGHVLLASAPPVKGATAIAEAAAALRVPIDQVHAPGSVVCTLNQVKAAKLHAARYFPGARVAPLITRAGGIDPERAEFVAQFLRDKTVCTFVEASLAKSSSKVKWRLKERRWPLWKRLVSSMQAKGLKPVAWSYFWELTGNGEYELQTADNCCCGTCRDLGYRNYEELVEIVKALVSCLEAASDGELKLRTIEKELIARIEKELQFRKGSFMSHLSDESSVGAHCLTMLLSSAVDGHFKKVCTHGRSDGVHVELPQTMEQMLGRKPKSSDWNGACEVCADATGRLKVERGNLLMCSHCNVVAHKLCVQRTHFDLPSSKDGDWTCWQCVQDIDAVQHDTSCDTCNEREYITADIVRLIEVLRKLESNRATREAAPETAATGPKKAKKAATPPAAALAPGSGRDAAASELLSARLEAFKVKEQEYISHIIRDCNQSGFKDLAIETLTFNSFYVLMDYWAKVNVTKADIACCEGNQIGISTHGMLFVYLNPSKEQRAAIDLKYGKQAWDLFGPTFEEGGPKYLEENYSVFCDDAKQNSFHTHSNIEATIREFLRVRPWLNEERRALEQSDGASNYRNPTLDLDCQVIGTHCFSEAGEGKDEEDKNAALHKRGFRSARDRGEDLECARELYDSARGMGLSGHNYGILHPARDCEILHVERESVHNISHYGMWNVAPAEGDSPEGITFFESLDRGASRDSIKRTGRAVGFGPGRTISRVEFDAKHRTHSAHTGAYLEMADSTPHPKARFSRDQKKISDAAVQEERAARAEKKALEAAQAQAEAKSHFEDSVEQCPNCKKCFMTSGWFARHTAALCVNRAEALRDKKNKKRVELILKERDALFLAQNAERLRTMRSVEVHLRGIRNSQFGGGRVGLRLDLPTRVVVDVDPNSLSYFSARIESGFILVSINNKLPDAQNLQLLERDLAPDTSLHLSFIRPSASLPLHGIARKSIHKSVRYVMHKEQLDWLSTKVFSNGQALLRDKEAACAMKSHFHNRMRDDIHAPMWLDQGQIATWLSSRVRDEKERRKAAKRPGQTAAGGGGRKRQKRPAEDMSSSSEASSSDSDGD